MLCSCSPSLESPNAESPKLQSGLVFGVRGDLRGSVKPRNVCKCPANPLYLTFQCTVSCAVLEDLRRGVPLAEVFELPAGASWRQVSHAVLLRGARPAAPPDWGLGAPAPAPGAAGR